MDRQFNCVFIPKAHTYSALWTKIQKEINHALSITAVDDFCLSLNSKFGYFKRNLKATSLMAQLPQQNYKMS